MVTLRQGEVMRASQPGRSVTTGGASEGAATGAYFDAAHAELTADPAIQFELRPVDQAELPPPPPRAEVPVPSGFDMPVSEGGPVALTIFWIVIGLAAAGLLYLIAARLAGWRRSGSSGALAVAEQEWRMEEAPARRLLDDADALAAQGRYSEAAHLLLHRSIGEIDQRRPATVRKALTSRDIAALPTLPPSPAAAFGAIVAAVERSLFGARPLDASDWQGCRAAYERFAFAQEWQG